MKPRSRRKWQAAIAGHAHNVRTEKGVLERQQRLDALKEHHLPEHSTRVGDIHDQELMAWSDDGGATGIVDRAGD